MLDFESGRRAAHGKELVGSVREVPPAQFYHYHWHLLRAQGANDHPGFAKPSQGALPRKPGTHGRTPACVVIGCFVGWHLRGALELCEYPCSRQRTARITLSVESGWQGLGIGTALMAQAVDVARERGIRQLHLTCHALNHRTQRIAERAGAKIGFEGCECFAVITVLDEAHAAGA